MKSVKEIRDDIANQLEKIYDAEEAKKVAQILLEDVFEIERMDFFTDKKLAIDSDQLSRYLNRLLEGEPIQYVTGVADFFGRKFSIQKGALIPRPETEELVRLILDENNRTKPKILDIGTGSGCIAISLALELNTQVLATDVSDEAARIARENSKQLDAEVEITIHNILNSELPYQDLDIIVSNPPYIPNSEMQSMNKNVTGYEPGLALFVPDDDPLLFYRKIAETGLILLRKGGRLYVEVHENYAQETSELIKKIGFHHVQTHQDMQGKDRMISATNSTSKWL